jgi:riboflavin kinase
MRVAFRHGTMAGTAATSDAAVGPDEVTALKRVALLGGLGGTAKASCAGLADELGVSSQTASRRLQRLDEAGLVARDVVSDGQWVSVTGDGEALLRREYADYRRLFEAAAGLSLSGTVTSGMGEGRHYISLSGYMEQFRERLDYEPYPGTLNVELDERSVRARPEMRSFDAVPIDGWADEERTFGPATCYAARVSRADDETTYGDAHAIVPERTHHDETELEVIAPDRLRDELGLADGDRVQVRIVDREAGA